MSTILDTDSFIINRDNQSYTVSAQDVKNQLGGSFAGEGAFDTPVQVLSPANGAGLTDSATYQPVTPPIVSDASYLAPQQFYAQFGTDPIPSNIVGPVTQCAPDGSIFQPTFGEVLSVTKTNYTSNVQYSGVINEGTVAGIFDGTDGNYISLEGAGATLDLTDCNLPIPITGQRIYCQVMNASGGAVIHADWSDGTTTVDAFSGSNSFTDYPPGKALLKVYFVGGSAFSYFRFNGIRMDDGDYTRGTAGGNWLRDNMWQLNFAEGTNNLRYVEYGQYIGPHNEQVASAGWKNNSLVLWTSDANNPANTSFIAGDIAVGPELTASAANVSTTSTSIELTNLSGRWFTGLSIKGAPITASAPSAESVEFTSMNFNTTPVTGTNVSLTNRRWSLESSSNESGPWAVVGSYDDDSANFTQNGASKWEGRPTLQSNTYYRVKVRYDSGNAPSVESTLNYFKTA